MTILSKDELVEHLNQTIIENFGSVQNFISLWNEGIDRAEKADRIADILETTDKYMDECGYEHYGDLTEEDIEYLAMEEQIGTAELVAILKEQF